MAQDAISLIKGDHRTVEGLFQQFSDPAVDERAQVVGAIIHELSVHAAVEEMILYPAVRKSVPGGESLANEALQEHQQVKETLAQLDGMDVTDQRVAAMVAELQAAVGDHVREEESEILPALQSALGSEEIDDMGRKIARAKAVAPTRPHPHAPDTPPGNMIAGLPAGLLDRIRDALDPAR